MLCKKSTTFTGEEKIFYDIGCIQEAFANFRLWRRSSGQRTYLTIRRCQFEFFRNKL